MLGDARFTELSQVGFVVRDLEAVVKEMHDRLGVDALITPLSDEGAFYKGKPAKFEAKAAFYHFANIELEFVEPVSGESVWQDFLDSGREGLHHIRFSTDSYEGTAKDMKEQGFDIYMQGPSVLKPGCIWSYFDTESTLKFIIESFNCKEKF